MAGPEKIEIQITGDSSDLANSLKDVAERVQSLVDALAGTTQKFNETGEVGKKTSKELGAAIDRLKKQTYQFSDQTKTMSDKMLEAAKSGKGLSSQAATMGSKLEAAADSAGRTDSAMSAFSSVLDKVNPGMAENARLAADVAGMTEQMILAMTQAPMAVAAIGVALVAYELTFGRAEKAAKRFEEANEDLSKGYDKQIKGMERLEKKRKQLEAGLKSALGTEESAVEIYRKERTEIDNLIGKEKQRAINRMKGASFDAEYLNNLESQRIGMIELADATFEAARARDELTLSAEEKALRKQIAALSTGTEQVKIWTDESGKQHTAIMLSGVALHHLGESLKETNEGLSVSGDSVNEFKSNVFRLNQALADLGESPPLDKEMGWGSGMWKLIATNIDGVQTAFGALNKSTGQQLNLAELNALAWSKTDDVANKVVKTTRKQTKAYDDLSGILEMLANMQFQAEQSLRSEKDAHAELFHKDMVMLDELTEEYRKSSEVKNAIDATRGALLDEFGSERVEFEKRAIAEIIRENRSMEDQLESLSAISKGRVFETLGFQIKQLEIVRDEQLKTLGRMEEDLLAAGHGQLEVERRVNAEKLDIEAEYLQAKDELNDEYRLEAEEADKELIDKRRDDLSSILASSESFAGSIGEVMAAYEEGITHMSIESRKKLFAAQKVAAVSGTIIAGAQAGIQAYADLGATPAAVLASAAIAASTAAAIATIVAQQPAFDIGGVVRGGVMSKSNDQVSASLLPGEAVLNRRAAGALGEQGVNALNSGGSVGQQVVVVPAYKHFDRFIKDEYRRGGSFRDIVTRQREFPVGRRSY